MRRIYAVRLTNARQLASEAGGVVRFGDRLGMSKAQASQIVGRNPIRQIGDDIAARIEVEFRKPADWLDTDHADPLPDLVRRLTPENREALIGVARALLGAQRSKVAP